MVDIKWPTVSIIIPTLNEERNIGACLKSIFDQNYPKGKLEVIVVDGKSSDNTTEIAKSYCVKLITNPDTTTGASRKIGVLEAKGEIMVFVDADNELPSNNWLLNMVSPLLDQPNIAGTVPIIWTKKTHPPVSRLYALMQANPVVTFAYSTGKNTKESIITEKNYFPMGGNGLLIRKSVIIEAGNFKSIRGQEDVDLTYRIVKLGYAFLLMSKVGIYHLSHRNLSHLIKKMYWRVSTFVGYSPSLTFQFVPNNELSLRFFKEVFHNVVFLGSLLRARKGIREDRDVAWIYYPIVVFVTVSMFGLVFLSSRRGRMMLKSVANHKRARTDLTKASS